MPVSAIRAYNSNGLRSDKVTHDFTKKETWYQQSVQVVDEVLSTSDNKVFTPATLRHWIDVTHGKLANEHRLHNDYQPVIKVNDVIKEENHPDSEFTVIDAIDKSDYSIDYTTGAVTFENTLEGTDVVKATYWYPTTSLFVIKPDASTEEEDFSLALNYVEIQLATDIQLTDTLIVQLWASADVFAPGQYPPGTLIPIQTSPDRYQTWNDFISDSEKAYPLIPAIPHPSEPNHWRHFTKDRMIFRFDYTAERLPTELLGSADFEFRCWLENDKPYIGEYATGTFYGIKRSEE